MTGSVFADELKEKYDELHQIQEKIRETESRLGSVRRQERGVLEELSALEQRLSRPRGNWPGWKGNCRQRKTHQRDHQGSGGSGSRTERQIEILGCRLRALYENGTVTYLDVLLSATDFSDFLNRADLMQEIINQDVVLLESIQQKRRK